MAVFVLRATSQALRHGETEMTLNIINGNDSGNTLAGTAGDDLIYGFDPNAASASANITATRVAAGFDFSQYDDCPAEALLLDGPAAELYGGAGKTFDWTLAGVTTRRIILAGGLDASNVAQAIALVHPWGVDACSRIESAPGKKDHRKMTEFLEAARAALRS